MIDLSQLTQEQQWGVQFVCLVANESLSEGATPFTPLSYLENVINVACNGYYDQLIKHKKTVALAMFDALSAEQQAQLVSQLGIPDVLPSEPVE
jgi:hypothetical protein